MELAWDNYHWDEDEYEGSQESFCSRVALMNKLEYLVWAREVKNCDWGLLTIRAAVKQGNLAMVKYCVENGCPMDAWTYVQVLNDIFHLHQQRNSREINKYT